MSEQSRAGAGQRRWVEKLTADPARGKGCWRFEPPLVLKGMRVQLVQNDADPYA